IAAMLMWPSLVGNTPVGTVRGCSLPLARGTLPSTSHCAAWKSSIDTWASSREVCTHWPSPVASRPSSAARMAWAQKCPAPRSAKVRTAVGPARTRVASSTVKRDRGPLRTSEEDGVGMGSGGGEHGNGLAAPGELEHDAHRLADAQRRRVAVDDVGHEGHALVEGDVGQREGGVALAHGAEGIQRAAARRLGPGRVLAQAEGADVARMVVHLSAGLAL